jgi:virginiamycin B lyase
VLRTIPVPNYPSGLAADDRATWVVYVLPGGESQGSAAAAVIDARFNDVTQTVELNRSFGGSDGIVLAAGSAWVADPGFVTRIDEESGKVQALIPVGLSGETDVIFDGAAIWAIGGSGIVRIDPTTNELAATIPVAQGLPSGPSPTALSVGSGAVWVANRLLGGRGQSFGSGKRGTVSRIDPATNAVVATITVGHEPFAIAADDTAVWVANRTDFTISKIDPRTNRVTDTIRIGNRPQGLAAGDGAVWVSVA